MHGSRVRGRPGPGAVSPAGAAPDSSVIPRRTRTRLGERGASPPADASGVGAPPRGEHEQRLLVDHPDRFRCRRSRHRRLPAVHVRVGRADASSTAPRWRRRPALVDVEPRRSGWRPCPSRKRLRSRVSVPRRLPAPTASAPLVRARLRTSAAAAAHRRVSTESRAALIPSRSWKSLDGRRDAGAGLDDGGRLDRIEEDPGVGRRGRRLDPSHELLGAARDGVEPVLAGGPRVPGGARPGLRVRSRGRGRARGRRCRPGAGSSERARRASPASWPRRPWPSSAGRRPWTSAPASPRARRAGSNA